MSASTKTQKEIQKHLEAIQALKTNGLIQDIVDVLQTKNYTREDVYRVTKAFDAEYEADMRRANLEKARKEKREKQGEGTPAS